LDDEPHSAASSGRGSFFLGLALFCVAGGGAFFLTQGALSSVKQPIAFSHKLHVLNKDAEARRNCLQCHVQGYEEADNAKKGDSIAVLYGKFLKKWNAESRVRALAEGKVIREPGMGIPRLNHCATCHGEEDEDKKKKKKKKAPSPDLLAVRAHVKKNKQISWKRIYRLTPDIVFSHARHAGLARVECSTCHGDVKKADRPLTRPEARAMAMSACMKCHHKNKDKTSNDCLTCHR